MSNFSGCLSIPEITGIVMRFFVSHGIPEKTWECHGIFSPRLSIFKLIILISYLLDNSPRQNMKRSQVSHQQRLHMFSCTCVYGCSKNCLLLSFCLANCYFYKFCHCL